MDQVELLTMKALSQGLVKGKIDQVPTFYRICTKLFSWFIMKTLSWITIENVFMFIMKMLSWLIMKMCSWFIMKMFSWFIMKMRSWFIMKMFSCLISNICRCKGICKFRLNKNVWFFFFIENVYNSIKINIRMWWSGENLQYLN